MDVIRFRAWDRIAEVMVKPVVVYSTGDHVGFDVNTFYEHYDEMDSHHIEWGDDWAYLFDCKVMQYTGANDKNGTDIYEGDIIHHDDGEDYIVTMDQGCYIAVQPQSKFEVLLWILPSHLIEVVGHIHEMEAYSDES